MAKLSKIHEIAIAAVGKLKLIREFNVNSYCVSENYIRQIGSLKNFKGVEKIAINVFQSIPKGYGENVICSDGVLIIDIDGFDIQEYLGKPAISKKHELLELTHRGCLDACDYLRIRVDSLLKAYDTIVTANFEFEISCSKPTKNRRKDMECFMTAVADLCYVDIVVEIRPAEGGLPIIRKKIVSFDPAEFWVFRPKFRVKWIGDNQVRSFISNSHVLNHRLDGGSDSLENERFIDTMF